MSASPLPSVASFGYSRSSIQIWHRGSPSSRISTGWHGNFCSRSACLSVFGLARGRRCPPSVHSWAVRLAWMVVIASLGYRLALIASQTWDLHVEWLRLSEVTLTHMKENLSALRLVHFLSAALLVATYLKSSSAFFSTAPAMAIIQTGRHSLEVFCLSASLRRAAQYCGRRKPAQVIERVIMDFGAISLVLLAAMLMSIERGRRFKSITAALDSPLSWPRGH